MSRPRGLTLLLAAALVACTTSSASAQPLGFEASLAGEGVAEQVRPECELARGSLSCAVYGIEPPPNADCDFGGAIAEVRLPATGQARRGFVCVDEAFHDWDELAPGQSWRRGAFECSRRWTGAGVGRMEVLTCRNTAGQGFSVDGVGRVSTDIAPPRSWLALGDSYASGHGIPGTVPGGAAHGRDCRRATGEGSATAWSVGSYRQVKAQFGFRRIAFVACSGAITDEATAQIEEARETSGIGRWDLVTLGFGGNNLGFSDVLLGCLDPRPGWASFDVTPGCDVSEKRLTARVDMLSGKRKINRREYKGSITLPTLLSAVASVVKPGGDVIVTGYPQLIEEAGRWPFWQLGSLAVCEGILRHDAGMLRSVTGYLNEQIGNAVDGADKAHRAREVRFHFVDIARNPYESGDDDASRHALCAQEEWINGLTPGIGRRELPLVRSFHPKQAGHTATARVVAALFGKSVKFETAAQPPAPLEARLPKLFTKERFAVRPPMVGYTGDGTGFVGKLPNGRGPGIRWSSWTAEFAEGSAEIWINDCEPDCAGGSFHAVAGTIRADRPRGGRFTHLAVRYSDRGKRIADFRVLRHVGGDPGYWDWFYAER